MSESLFRDSWRRGALLALGALLIAALPVVAQEEADPILERLGERYEVLQLSEGWGLRPRSEDADFGILEVLDGGVAVDSERVDADDLRRLIGDDADDVLLLAGVSSPVAATEASAEAAADDDEEAQRLEREAREEERRERRERESHRDKVRSEGRLSVGSDVTVEEGESAKDVVVFGGSIDIDGEVRGDAVALGGSVDVNGKVTGGVTAVGGSVFLGRDAEVFGEVVSVGGEVERHPQAKVRGSVSEVSGPRFGWGELDWDWGRPRFGLDWADLFGLTGNIILLALLTMLIYLLAGRYVQPISEIVGEEGWKAGLVGLLVQLLFGPVLLLVTLVLAISIIGIPVLLLLLPAVTLVTFVAFLTGFTAVALRGGQWLDKRFNFGVTSPYVMVILGVLLIQGWQWLGEGLSFGGGPIKLTAWLLIFFGMLIKYLAWTIGLGAFVLKVFTSPSESRGSLPPLPPPPPPAPDDDTDWMGESAPLWPEDEAGDASEEDPDAIYDQAGGPAGAEEEASVEDEEPTPDDSEGGAEEKPSDKG